MIRIVVILFFLLSAGFLYKVLFSGDNPTNVEVMVLKPTVIDSTIRVTGRVESARRVDLSPFLQGVVTAVMVKEGDAVEANGVLMSLDDKQAHVQVKIMEHRLASIEQAADNLRRKYERLESVSRSGGVSTQALEEESSTLLAAESDVHLTRRQLESARIFLQDTELRAPFAGRILNKEVEIGQWVEPSDVVMTLAAWDERWIAAEVDAADSTLVAPGQLVYVSADGWPDKVWEEKIEWKSLAIESQESSSSNTFEVRTSLGPEAPELLLGQQVDVQILVARRENALAIPFSSLREKDDEFFVAVMEEGIVRYRPVRTGIEDLTRIEVLSGLESGDRVIVSSTTAVNEGDEVTVAKTNP